LNAGWASHCTPLDTLRGIAVAMMLLNHAGVSLLRPELVAGGSSPGGALTFIGSFAPVLFFFTTGFGYGWRDPGPRRAGEKRDVLYKACVLIAADVLLRGGSWLDFGWDFLGFIGFCILAVHPLRRHRRGEALALVAIAALLGLRFGAAPLAALASAGSPFQTAVAQALGQKSIPGISYPFTPWLVYPFAGFALARWARRFSASTHPLAGAGVWAASATLAALAWALASLGMPVERWGAMTLAYFVASLGVLGACIAASFAMDRTGPGRHSARLIAVAGLSSLAFVPIHYALILSLEPWLAGALASAGYAGAVLFLLPVVMFISRLVGRWAEQTAPSLGRVGGARGIGLASLAALGGVTTDLGPSILTTSLCQLGMLFSVWLFAIRATAIARAVEEVARSKGASPN
jgi:uncharacterized membrane protein